MQRLFLVAIVCVALSALTFPGRANPAPLRVACLGDSITAGSGLKEPARESYPAQLAALLGDGYEVRNFGVMNARPGR